MDFEKIMSMLQGKTDPKLVRFVSDKGPNSCKKCLMHHGEIFRLNAPENPKLPIHPNCRCKYELLTYKESITYQENVQKIKAQLVNYGTRIAIRSTQLLTEYEKVIKAHATITTTNTVTTALVTALQVSLWTMEKIDIANKFLQKKMENTGLNPVLDELISWLSPMQKIEDSLKKWHYNRLNNPMQQPWSLPQSPEEAIQRGFVQVPDDQNWYHRNKGQLDNVKYQQPATGQEVIFNGQGKVVNDIENIGTYNYFPITETDDNITDSINAILHFAFDVVPYYRWGNDEDDTTSLGNRLLGPKNGPVFDDCLTILKIILEFEKHNFKLRISQIL